MSTDRNEFNVKEKTFDEVMDFLGEKWKDFTKNQQETILKYLIDTRTCVKHEGFYYGKKRIDVDIKKVEDGENEAIVFYHYTNKYVVEDIIRRSILSIFHTYGKDADGVYEINMVDDEHLLGDSYLLVVDNCKPVYLTEVNKLLLSNLGYGVMV